MEIEARYQEIEQIHQAAFTTFRRRYELETPPPVKPVQQAKRDRFMRLVLLLVVAGSLIVSASHTVSVFSHGKSTLVGIAAFLMLESGAVSLGFYQAREKYQSREVDSRHMLRYMTAGVWLAVFVMAAGNIQDVFMVAGFADGSLWLVINFGISVAVALSAPLMVLIVSHVLAMLYVKDLAFDRRAELDYEEKVKAWHDDMLRSWQPQKRRYGATVDINVSSPSAGQLDGRTADNILPALSVRTGADGQRTDSGHGFERNAKGKEIVRQHLTEYPEDVTAKVRELAERLGVGRTTVSEVQREFKAGG